jgi:hypothetical protein
MANKQSKYNKLIKALNRHHKNRLKHKNETMIGPEGIKQWAGNWKPGRK